MVILLPYFTGTFTEDVKKFLKGVLQEVSTSQRLLELDTFLPSINCHTIQNSKSFSFKCMHLNTN